MKSVSDLIYLLGGTNKVANYLNIKPSAVSNWKKKNIIPKNKQKLIKDLCLIHKTNIYENLFTENSNNTHNNVLLIISGGVASYKSIEIIRLIKKTKINLDIIITKSAQKFITPLLVTSLNEKKCYTDLFSIEDEAEMNHISLARKADIILIAPATANLIAKMANGIADDLASTTILASLAKIIIAPSMNPVMWNSSVTRDNCKKLVDRGVVFIEPETGDMACGEHGVGRLPEPKFIFDELINELNTKKEFKNNRLKDITVIITAGPTEEDIDPVRFVSNKSSGKQAYAIASELSDRGADVTLITGPTRTSLPLNLKVIEVRTADEMYQTTMSNLPADVVICAAAVADWKLTPNIDESNYFDLKNKIKKTEKSISFKTIQNPDILLSVSKGKLKPKLTIGFAAETKDLIKNAKEKLITKDVDLIIANDVSNNKVFGSDFNKVYIIDKYKCEEWVKQSKKSVAINLANKINEYFTLKSGFLNK